MGINIRAYHFQGFGEEPDYFGMRTYPILEEVDGWDWYCYAGDRDIPSAVDYTRTPWDDNEGNYRDYYRPKSIAELRSWVQANIYEGNQERWLTLLKQMEADDTIWLHFGW